MFKLWSLITVLGLAAFPGFPAEQNPSLLKGRLLLPGIVSTGLFERDFTLSSDGKEIYFTVMGPGFSVIMTTSFTRGKWTSPFPASFSGHREYFDAEPFLSDDGRRLYFLSTRPLPGESAPSGWDYENIWVVKKKKHEWGKPVPLDNAVNNGDNNYCPTLSKEGILFFTRSPRGGKREAFLYQAIRTSDGLYLSERLPFPLNSHSFQFNSCVGPEGKFLLFILSGHEKNINTNDIRGSFYFEEKGWSHPVNLGTCVNFPGGNAVSVSLTPDGKTIVFASRFLNTEQIPPVLTYDNIHLFVQGPQNGSSDLYLISADILLPLREQARWDGE